VTEQDVVNEEMYEEEEADLPVQYRRLQAYMAMAQTNNVFDGRLNSYLLSTMATRNMANAGFMNPSMSSYQSTPFFPYTPPQNGNQMQSPTSMQAPSAVYRSMPQSPQQQGSSQQVVSASHPQSMQMSSSIDAKPQVATVAQHTHISSPQGASPAQAASPVLSRSPNSQSSAHPNQSSAPGTPAVHSINQNPLHAGYMGSFADAQQTYGQQQMSPNNFSNYDPMGQMFGRVDMNLLSSTLPVEAQQMFGTNAFDLASFQNPYLMNQNHGLMVPPNGVGDHYNPNPSPSKPRQDSQVSYGMNQTLSQSSYQTMQNAEKSNSYASMDDEESSYTSNMSFDFGSTYTNDGAQGGLSPNNNEFVDFFDSDGGQSMA
jgi:hypothetical protein